MIEFQSVVDKFMAQRILRYILEFYDYLIRIKKVKTLPGIFPVMLYNGNAKWSAPVQISELIDKNCIPTKYIPQFNYCKIAENEFKRVLSNLM